MSEMSAARLRQMLRQLEEQEGQQPLARVSPQKTTVTACTAGNSHVCAARRIDRMPSATVVEVKPRDQVVSPVTKNSDRQPTATPAAAATLPNTATTTTTTTNVQRPEEKLDSDQLKRAIEIARDTLRKLEQEAAEIGGSLSRMMGTTNQHLGVLHLAEVSEMQQSLAAMLRRITDFGGSNEAQLEEAFRAVSEVNERDISMLSSNEVERRERDALLSLLRSIASQVRGQRSNLHDLLTLRQMRDVILNHATCVLHRVSSAVSQLEAKAVLDISVKRERLVPSKGRAFVAMQDRRCLTERETSDLDSALNARPVMEQAAKLQALVDSLHEADVEGEAGVLGNLAAQFATLRSISSLSDDLARDLREADEREQKVHHTSVQRYREIVDAMHAAHAAIIPDSESI